MKQNEVASSCSTLHYVEVRVAQGFSGLSAKERFAWNVLFEEQIDAVPFQSLAWNEGWWEVFGRSSLAVGKEAVILVLSRDDEIIGFFPMFRATFSFLGFPLLRHVKPMGSDRNLTEVKIGIVREGHERDAHAAVLEHFKNAGCRWELLSLPALPDVAFDAGGAMSSEHPTAPVIEGFIITLSDDWPTFQRGLKRNVKEAIRKCHNSLRRDGIEPVFDCLSGAAAILEMLPEFYRLHAERARSRDSVSHLDYFQSKDVRSFIELLASDPKNSGIRLFVLKHGDRLIAARLAFETHRGTYLYYSGYDLEYGKYSIMTQLVIEILKRSIARGHKHVHLSFGRDRSKTRWSPREKIYKQHLLFRHSLRGRLAAPFYTAFLKWRERVARSGVRPLTAVTRLYRDGRAQTWDRGQKDRPQPPR